MDDPSRFTSINEYYTFIYAISYMMLVELGIWIYNFKGWLKRPDKKNNDYGTILIVMLEVIMNNVDKNLLKEINETLDEKTEVYNIRKNGESIKKKVNSYIDIVTKEDKSGLDIYVKENTLFGIVHIPVIITESGLSDVVYNDFHIGADANVIIMAGCGIHNDLHKNSEHDGIHRFYLEENAKVKYVEKHYGEGKGKGKKILNPTTEIYMKKGSSMNMDSVQIKGVDDTIRITKATLDANTTLEISEKILTTGKQTAKTEFIVDLNGENASVHVTSRSVAEGSSTQKILMLI